MSKDFPSIEDLLKKSVPTATPVSTSSTSLPTEKFEEKMTAIHTSEKETEAQKEAAAAGVGYVNLVGFAISPEALTIIPEEQAKALGAIVFLFTGPELRLGAVVPNDPKVKELAYQLGERHHTNAQVYKVSAHSLEKALELYAALPKITATSKGVELTDEELAKYRAEVKNFATVQALLDKASTTDVMSIMISAALELNSSDIHVEAGESGVKMRLRVDGMLQDVANLPIEEWKKISSRIKLIAGLKINVTDRPQDGRFTIFLKEEKIDVRTSTLPTAYGESVVMRLLTSEAVKLGFEALGLRPAMFAKLKKEIEKPHGMVLTTGPTGSGKTTTLYAVLQRLNKPNVKMITLEDPIEYKLAGVNQSQIDHTKDYTFAKGLRSILRQDPDIVMVGEIRDLETAEIAIQAALTGHLMLSTIHTNDAAGAIPRFLSMGVKPFLLAPALNALVGQRLLRKIHEDCKEEVALDAETLARVKAVLSEIPQNSGEIVNLDNLKFFHGKGCEVCNMTGFKGRIGIYEILVMNKEVEEAVLAGNVSEYQMREIAKAQGMVTLAQDGILKALDGITSVEEVFRVATE
ncbi:MAG: GspE/PulE family protein [Patescibacteria group bacterium]